MLPWTSADIQNTRISTRGHGARGHAVLAADTRGQLRTLRGHTKMSRKYFKVFGLEELSILSLSASAATQPPRTSRSRGPCALTAEDHTTPRHAQRKLSTPPKCQWCRNTPGPSLAARAYTSIPPQRHAPLRQILQPSEKSLRGIQLLPQSAHHFSFMQLYLNH